MALHANAHKTLGSGRFDPYALYLALDAQRLARGLSWSQVGEEIGVSPSTITRTRLGGRMEVDGMLSMVRWLGRSVESFTQGYIPPGTSQSLDTPDELDQISRCCTCS